MKKLTDLLKTIPGISPKMSEKISVYLIQNKETMINNLEQIIDETKENKICTKCNNIFKNNCLNCEKNKSRIFVVENNIDSMALVNKAKIEEPTFVLEINLRKQFSDYELINKRINQLIEMLNENSEEIIISLTPSVETELLIRSLKELMARNNIKDIKVSNLSAGIPLGGSVQYYDEQTIKEAIKNREKS